MMTSLCKTLWQLILAQGICVGLGSGALFLTAVATVSSYFTSRKSIAVGIAASGSSLGGVIYPIMFRRLQPAVGFAWDVRILVFTVLATCLVPCVTIHMLNRPGGKRKIFDVVFIQELSFDLLSAAWFFMNMGTYIPFFFVQQFAQDVVGLGDSLAFYMLTILNAGSVFGRILPGLLADKTHPTLVIAGATLSSTALSFGWIGVGHGNVAGMVIFCVLYGFFAGSLVSLSTPSAVSLAPDLKGIGTRLGMFNFLGSLGLLVGAPSAGAILEKSWIGVQIFCGLANAAGFVLVILTRLVHQKQKRRSPASK